MVFVVFNIFPLCYYKIVITEHLDNGVQQGKRYKWPDDQLRQII